MMSQVTLAEEGKLTVDEAWTRPHILLNRPTAAYFTIHNGTGQADQLVAASSSIADRIEFHQSRNMDGIMRMVKLDHVLIKAGEDIEFKPGSYHLMVFGMKKKISFGEGIPLTLTFKQAGKVEVLAEISGKALVKSGRTMDHNKMKHDH